MFGSLLSSIGLGKKDAEDAAKMAREQLGKAKAESGKIQMNDKKKGKKGRAKEKKVKPIPSDPDEDEDEEEEEEVTSSESMPKASETRKAGERRPSEGGEADKVYSFSGPDRIPPALRDRFPKGIGAANFNNDPKLEAALMEQQRKRDLMNIPAVEGPTTRPETSAFLVGMVRQTFEELD